MSHKSHASHEDDPSIRLHASTSHWPMNRRGELQIGEAGARVSNESIVPGVSRATRRSFTRRQPWRNACRCRHIPTTTEGLSNELQHSSHLQRGRCPRAGLPQDAVGGGLPGAPIRWYVESPDNASAINFGIDFRRGADEPGHGTADGGVDTLDMFVGTFAASPSAPTNER